MPISGRPPSLINRPSGCHFHPRCPYAREAHKRVDPRLQPVNGSSSHLAACLLENSVRERIWDGIRSGRDQESLVRIAASSVEPAVEAASLIPVEEESEGTGQTPSELELEREEDDTPSASPAPGHHPYGRPGVPMEGDQ